MPTELTDRQRAALAARVRYYRELGIYDLYRRAPAVAEEPTDAVPSADASQPAAAPPAPARAADSPGLFQAQVPENRPGISPAEKLKIIREDLGECTRCVLHKLGRKQIVYGTGNPNAELMFVGEGPGADEDEQGIPFVGRAGQLLNEMIRAMGLKREQVYIANVVKCRPPGNRTPEREECDTCLPFLLRQIDAIAPRYIVALGAVAAKNLLSLNDAMARLRGRWYDCRGARLLVTYHPAFLLRDPRQKKEAWKDLQMVMREMGLPVPAKPPQS